MRALDTIANSIRLGYIHPTVMLNTLIETENGGGLREVRRIERHLARGVRALQQRQHPHAEIAEKWLRGTQLYLTTQTGRRRAS